MAISTGLLERLGSVRLTMSRSGALHLCRFDWIATAAGECLAYWQNPPAGRLWHLETDPTGAPTNLYDLFVYDLHARDLLLGKGVDRLAASAESVDIYTVDASGNRVYSYCDGRPVSFTIAAAGASKYGVAILTIAEAVDVTHYPRLTSD